MADAHANELAIPPDLMADGEARELVRIWDSDGSQYFLIDVEGVEDPAAWGFWALDLMKHAARAYEAHNGQPRQEVYKRILSGFMVEMQNPTEPL